VPDKIGKESSDSLLAAIIKFPTIVQSEARMSELKFVSWKEIFQKAIEETDRDKRAQLVQQADLAIFHRKQQLFNCDRHREELSAMNAATEALRVVKHAARELVNLDGPSTALSPHDSGCGGLDWCSPALQPTSLDH